MRMLALIDSNHCFTRKKQVTQYNFCIILTLFFSLSNVYKPTHIMEAYCIRKGFNLITFQK